MTNEKWELVKLGDVVDVNPETRSPVKENWDDIIVYVDIDAVENSTGKITSPKTLRFRDAPSRARRVIHEDDVLVSMVRPELKAFAYVPKELDNQICSTGFAVLRGKGLTNPLYLLNVMFSEQVISQFRKLTVGGQYPSLTQKTISQIVIPLPPLPEQQRIASILSAADKAIEEAGLAIEESERIKSGLMQKLITNSESKNYILNDVILEYLNGGTPSTKKPEYWNGDIHWTTSANLNGYYLNSGEKKITQEGLKHSSTNLVPMGNIIIATRVGLGKSVINCVDIAISQDLTGLILDQSKIDREYLAHYLKSDKVIQKIINSAQGTTIKGITRDALGNIPLLLPHISKQKRIASCLSTADEKISLCKKRKAILEKMKQGLMQTLLSNT